MAATQPAGRGGGGKGRTAGTARRGGEGSQTHSNKSCTVDCRWDSSVVSAQTRVRFYSGNSSNK